MRTRRASGRRSSLFDPDTGRSVTAWGGETLATWPMFPRRPGAMLALRLRSDCSHYETFSATHRAERELT